MNSSGSGEGAVFVGRFQPPHHAHVSTVLAALDAAPHVLVLLGSANLARSVKNPFTAQERHAMFAAALAQRGADLHRVTFRPLPDRFDADLWAADVRAVAAQVFGPDARVALVGFEKDASTGYLQWFPGWTRLVTPEEPGLNATDIRAALFTRQPLPGGLPGPVLDFLRQFPQGRGFPRLVREWQAVQAARAAAGPGPHRELRWLDVRGPDLTLHQRTQDIGQGLWELPGRPLVVGEGVPEGATVFDHPSRSLVVPSAAYVLRAAAPPEYPGERVAIAHALLRPRKFFEDHHVILTRMLGREED
ncbi:ADP-ribose pyrophosphatase [Deinococcus cavernae]|uniref:ADP-ribose pyrophosphatase n=1 Tax=Deinococcus cavernae TaxID=2320857 RepID=A0A418V029_9DEIO|nr:adenylyltransferase/cytidyltransferase family protein [Deinococcus cavernae]RJF69077.1 ADP-ribose pyrophosphatase [Deinococcus cavernae]